MAVTSRLNRVIGTLETGQRAFAAFASADPAAAVEFSTTAYDALVFETEHKPWDIAALRDSFQYLLNRKQIFEAETLSPAITPIVRIPPNGSERAQWHAKQALDLGAFGIVWPHISTVEDAYNAVAACRYPKLPGHPRYDPAGVRGDGPVAACRYWGLSNDDYYAKSDVWPLDANGEILVAIMIEDAQGLENLPKILGEVPGIGLVLIGEGDMSQELGFPRQYDHPRMLEVKRQVIECCAKYDVAVGHPHVTDANLERVLEDGYRFLMTAPVRTFPALDRGRRLTGRA